MNFFKTFLAGLLAVIVAFFVMGMVWTLVLVGVMASLGSSMSSAKPVTSESVLRLDLGTISDSPSQSVEELFTSLSAGGGSRTTLYKAISAINSATTDDRIKGLYINLDEYTNVSISSVEEIRAALVEFKESGKFIVAYNEVYSQGAYYLASVADKVYMNPEGEFDWRGLAMQTMFYKGLLDKLGVEPVVIRHGTFKAAVEPFILNKMSDANRLQNQTLANALWGTITEAVSASRNISVEKLQEWANTLAVNSPEAALSLGLIDGLLYEDQVKAELVALIGGETPSEDDAAKEADPKIVAFADYVAQLTPAKSLSKNKVAVIYAQGDIVDGTGAMGEVGSTSLAAKIVKARRDANVKAVVLRVNSPGGSALASEVMWRELTLLKEKVPVIVSMGDYAASGGYYISAPADVIFTNRTTITGSIGVFGLFFNAGDALKNKLGVTVDVVATNAHGDMGSMFRSPSEAETRYLQHSVEQVYTTFVSHVAAGRNMTPEAVDKIGEGRVWSGADAVSLGLADDIGGLYDAIAIAADRAGVVEDFRVWEVPDEATGLSALLSGTMASVRRAVRSEAMGETFVHYNNLVRSLQTSGVQARLPYTFVIE
ncbi:MAG: signal peptide peptidase SppA [Rikenellaceae bacterium]|jgi:protease-4|nr:signal peptide peptidase SppA [Rikenellaceae bacterium]